MVTGANGGLGLETTRLLARRGAHVVMAARDLTKAAAAEEDIRTSVAAASIEVAALDLGSLQSIRSFASAIGKRHPVIDLVINNAGVMGTPRLETSDGFELQFGTNHLGHFALDALLLPALLRAPAGRVVTVTSTSRHYRWPYDEDDLHLNKRYDPWRAYGRSKLANTHFAVELDRRLRRTGAAAHSLVAHPGFSNTDLQAASARSSPDGRSQRFFRDAVERFGVTASAGALPQLRAATDPGAGGGELYAPRWVGRGPPVRRPLTRRSLNRRAMEQLWEISERETGIAFDVAQMVTEALRSQQ